MKRTITACGSPYVGGTWVGCRDARLECGHTIMLLPADKQVVGDTINCTRCDPRAPTPEPKSRKAGAR